MLYYTKLEINQTEALALTKMNIQSLFILSLNGEWKLYSFPICAFQKFLSLIMQIILTFPNIKF